MSKNMVLGKTFGRKRDKVTGDWRKLHSEEFHDFFCSLPNIQVIRSRREGGREGGREREREREAYQVAHMGEKKNL
jgi:hypothetical protein